MTTHAPPTSCEGGVGTLPVTRRGIGAVIRRIRGGLTSALIDEPGLIVCALYVVEIVILAGVMALMASGLASSAQATGQSICRCSRVFTALSPPATQRGPLVAHQAPPGWSWVRGDVRPPLDRGP